MSQSVVEKPPFEQTDGEGVLVVGTQSFEPFDYQSTIDVTAATQASKTRQIRSDLAGEIERLAIERGDVVRPGDVIAINRSRNPHQPNCAGPSKPRASPC